MTGDHLSTAEEEDLGGTPGLVLLFEGERPDPALVATMVERLGADPAIDAVGTAQVVTDAVKVVDDDGRVRATLDRSRLVSLGLPAVVRRRAWKARQIRAIGLI